MLKAAIIMFVAMSLIPAGDSAGKILTTQFGVAPIFVAWSRFMIGMALVLPFVPKGMVQLYTDWRVWLRAGFLAAGISSIQVALTTTPVATVFAVFFVGPLFSYLLAVVFLREHVTWFRSILVLLGFAGVLLVVRPSSDISSGVLWALNAGLCYGAFLTMSRWLTGHAAPMALVVSQLSISALILLPWGLLNMPEITSPVAKLTFVSAACSMLGNLLLLYAYRHAAATRIAPLVYFQLIAAVLLGWLLFDDLPDMITWVGLAVIIASGVGSARLR